VTAVSPNGLTSVTGKWAGDLKARCDALGLKCSVIDDEQEFRKAMFEKLMWIATLQVSKRVESPWSKSIIFLVLMKT